MRESIESLLLGTQMLITNATHNPQLQERLKEYGYTPQRMLEADTLLGNAQLRQSEKEKQYSRQKELSARFKQDMERLKTQYREHLSLARFAFRHDVTQQTWLELNGPRKTRVTDFLAQVKKFYARVEPLLPQLKKYSAVPQEFEQGKAQVAAVIATRQQWLNGKGEAEQATQQRNEAMKELNNWVVRFKQVARIACYEQPQLLESIGIKV